MTKTYPLAFELFEKANPDIARWWTDSTFGFAVSLREQVLGGKVLTERQMSAALNCALKASAQTRRPSVEVDIRMVEHSLANAVRHGLTRPKLRLLAKDDQTYVISQAPAHGTNAGSLYVKRHDDDCYMGKIREGHFFRSNVCTNDDEAAIVEACATPEHSSVAYGRRFGSCSCCGRTLTNALSIELGIGPICRGNFFG